MSQRNETVVLFLALIITLRVVGGIVSWLTSNSGSKIVDLNLLSIIKQDLGDLNPGKITNQSVSNRLSFREKILMPEVRASTKQLGIKAIVAGENDKVIANFLACQGNCGTLMLTGELL